MYSIGQLSVLLHPEKSEKELADFVLLADQNSSEYYSRTWNSVKKEDLGNVKVQVNLVRTLFHSQNVIMDSPEDILSSLEEWSDNTLIFDNLPIVESLFYKRYYTLLGFLNFDNITIKRRAHLLGTECLLYACIWDIPIYILVQNHFANFAQLDLLKTDSLLFARIIWRNKAAFGDIDSPDSTVSEWINEFNEFEGVTVEGKVDEFMTDNFKVARLKDEEKKIISKILTLYWGLLTGLIWKEIKDAPAAGYEKKEKPESKTLENYYIELLNQAESADILSWLEDYKDIALWLSASKNQLDLLHKILFILMKKLDLKNPKAVELALNFFHELKNLGVEMIDEVFYFDEKAGKFVWDEELVVPVESIEKPKAEQKSKEELEKLKQSLVK
jgi:hypothetical protein